MNQKPMDTIYTTVEAHLSLFDRFKALLHGTVVLRTETDVFPNELGGVNATTRSSVYVPRLIKSRQRGGYAEVPKW